MNMDGTISDRWLMRDTDSEDMTSYSVMVNNDGFSKGKHLGFFEKNELQTVDCHLFSNLAFISHN